MTAKRRPGDWRDMQVVIGNVIGTVSEHAAQLRAEGIGDDAAAYAISSAIGRACDGEKPGPLVLTMEQYRASQAKLKRAVWR